MGRGHRITLTPTVGGNVTIRLRQYSKACNDANSGYYQAETLVSNDGQITVTRNPTLNVTGFPAEVRCGD